MGAGAPVGGGACTAPTLAPLPGGAGKNDEFSDTTGSATVGPPLPGEHQPRPIGSAG